MSAILFILPIILPVIAGMIVHQHQIGAAVQQGFPKDFSRIDIAGVDRSDKQHSPADDAVMRIEIQYHEFFLQLISDFALQPPHDFLRAVHDIAFHRCFA